MKQFTRRGFGAITTGIICVAEINLGKGPWEITGASVRMGGPTPAINGNAPANGYISWRKKDESGNVTEEVYLASGWCSMFNSLIMENSHRVEGRGSLYAYMLDFGGASESTFDVTYRRVEYV